MARLHRFIKGWLALFLCWPFTDGATTTDPHGTFLITTIIKKGSFTLVTFVGDNASDSDM
jgi:hypothetical protein